MFVTLAVPAGSVAALVIFSLLLVGGIVGYFYFNKKKKDETKNERPEHPSAV